MATTEIHAIALTPDLALKYCLSDKVEQINSEEEIDYDVPHETFELDGQLYVRYFTLTSFQNCNVNNPYYSFEYLQGKWQNVKYNNNGTRAKNGREPLMYHLIQSFNGHEISVETANEIGRKLAEEVFPAFTVTVSTHGNTENIHNHFNISAWDESGRKWNDCHATKRLIRRTSDRLCEEYGLSVLKATKNMELIKYKDTNGKTRYYEPTERKNELIRKRENGEIFTDNIRSYRNTQAYSNKQANLETNRNEIKADIDVLLPSCRNYEELLTRLRELGYNIRDKKKNGEWLSHVSFQAPTQNKATREDKLGDGKFYLRKNLEKYILDNNKSANRTHREYEGRPLPYFSEYRYGEIDVSALDKDYKAVVSDVGEIVTLPRSDAERSVLSDILANDIEVKGLVDTSELHRIIESQHYNKGNGRLSNKRVENLVTQIQSGLRCLKYIEQHDIYGYEQILDLYSVSRKKYDAAFVNFQKAEAALDGLNEVLEVPAKMSALKMTIEANINNAEYMVEQYYIDRKTLRGYESLLVKYKIDTPHGENVLRSKVAEFEAKQTVNREYMSRVTFQMSELENCIRTFDRIDAARGNRNEAAMERFYQLSKKTAVSTDDNVRKKTKRREDVRGEY